MVQALAQEADDQILVRLAEVHPRHVHQGEAPLQATCGALRPAPSPRMEALGPSLHPHLYLVRGKRVRSAVLTHSLHHAELPRVWSLREVPNDVRDLP